jgi:iron complex outermembrane receptor protein
MRKVLCAVIVIAAFAARQAQAGEEKRLDNIVVTPSRLELSESPGGRSVTVLDAGTMDMSAYGAIQDIIGALGGIDIRRRSPEGVQADVNIRGASFEQNTVMIDGVKINDAQTGHHTMDLPLTTFDMERSEILKGPASSLYGANSFGGVINLITKLPEEKKFEARATGGARDYFSGGLSISYPFERIKNRFSIEWSRASPYIPDSEFSIINLSERSAIDTAAGPVDFLFGYAYKDFGANWFYSNLFPREAEQTDTRFFKLGSTLEHGCLKFMPKLFLRRHYDKFMTDKDRAGFATNYHTNYTFGADLTFALENHFLDTAYGVETAADNIYSTNLGKRGRIRTGLYLEITPHLHEKLYLSAGVRQDTFSDFSAEYSPSVNARFMVTPSLSARAMAGRSFRIPTFTDLYYNSATSAGNPGLKSESSWTYEAGIDCSKGPIKCSATYFNRQSYDTIDWIRNNVSERWRVSNVGGVETNGAEGAVELNPCGAIRLPAGASASIDRLFVRYTALDLFGKHDYLSQYVFDYLKQEITGGVECRLAGFTNSWTLNYKKRVGTADSAVIVDMKLVKEIIKKGTLMFSAFLEMTNIFDADYSEQSGIPMPGRWIKSGIRITY